VEKRFNRKQAARQHGSEKTSCDRMFIEVHNGSGAQIAVFEVESNGEEVGKRPSRFARLFFSVAVCSPSSMSLSRRVVVGSQSLAGVKKVGAKSTR